MRTLKIFLLIPLLILFLSCGEAPTNKVYSHLNYEQVNDSTVDVLRWIDSLNGLYLKIQNKDTISKALVSKFGDYLHYKYINQSGVIITLKLFVKINDKYNLNEIIYFDEHNRIKESESTYIMCDTFNDSIKLTLPSKYFNRTSVVLSDDDTFDNTSWINVDTLNSQYNYIVIPKKHEKKGILIGIKDSVLQNEGEFSKMESSSKIYFDSNNLRNRDIRKSLLR